MKATVTTTPGALHFRQTMEGALADGVITQRELTGLRTAWQAVEDSPQTRRFLGRDAEQVLHLVRSNHRVDGLEAQNILGLQVTNAIAVRAGDIIEPPAGMASWGQLGHELTNSIAAEATRQFADAFPTFLGEYAEEIAYLGPEPDRWRDSRDHALKNAQTPDHFINFESIADLGALPRGRFEYIAKLLQAKAGERPERVGLQPYAAIEVFQRLRVAMRELRKREEDGRSVAGARHTAVMYAGWLGHYVADGAQPLHTTIHHNGWKGDPSKGYTTGNRIHSLFETQLVRQAADPGEITKRLREPRYLENPFEDYLEFLQESHHHVERVYQLEKEGALKNGGSQEARDFLHDRLAAGVQMLLDLWHTAWIDSGQLASVDVHELDGDCLPDCSS